MHQDLYYTIEENSEGLYKEKGSKFIAYLSHCNELNKFEEFQLTVKKTHPKARHFCYAYKIGHEDKVFRMNDDGEPSGTAGKPIYGQILSANLTNVGIIVVRYFGGTKLGASGLIKAYKSAAFEAISNGSIVERWITKNITISFDYEKMGSLLKALKDLKVDIAKNNFDANPNVLLQVNNSEIELTITKIKAKLLNRPIEDIIEDDQIAGIRFKF